MFEPANLPTEEYLTMRLRQVGLTEEEIREIIKLLLTPATEEDSNETK